ncbi:hypothetical protein BKA80DRAFT_259819 [Phyllosticta citrichinensis]
MRYIDIQQQTGSNCENQPARQTCRPPLLDLTTHDTQQSNRESALQCSSRLALPLALINSVNSVNSVRQLCCCYLQQKRQVATTLSLQRKLSAISCCRPPTVRTHHHFSLSSTAAVIAAAPETRCPAPLLLESRGPSSPPFRRIGRSASWPTSHPSIYCSHGSAELFRSVFRPPFGVDTTVNMGRWSSRA